MSIASYVEKACLALARRLEKRVITRGDNSPYLERHYIFRKRWVPKWAPQLPSVYLHHFLRGDDEVELHNHPWRLSLSLILAGGYREERRVGTRIKSRMVRPGMINIIRGNDYHRVELLDPKKGAWTLFITTTREQNWGFWHPQTKEFLFWEDHLKQRISRGFANFSFPRPAKISSN